MKLNLITKKDEFESIGWISFGTDKLDFLGTLVDRYIVIYPSSGKLDKIILTKTDINLFL